MLRERKESLRSNESNKYDFYDKHKKDDPEYDLKLTRKNQMDW